MFNMPKVVQLTSVHTPFDIRIFYKECRTLAQAGYDVVLVVPHDKSQVVDGVRIRAVPKPKNRRERMMKTIWQVYKAAVAENADVYHFHDPELIPVGIMLKLKGKKVIYDVHEDVPRQILTKFWIPSLLRPVTAKCASLFEKLGSKFFDGIIATTPTVASRFPDCKTILVRNFPILGELVSPDAMPYYDRPANIVYVGGISALRGIREMIKAMELLPEEMGARLCLAGTFSSAELHNEICVMPGWEKVEFLGWQTREQVRSLMGLARIGLILFHPAPNHYDSDPNKLFEYMSAGIPVVASDFPFSDFPTWKKIVKETGCGILANPQDPHSIAVAIEWLLEHPNDAETMGKRGQEAVYKFYNWDHEAKALLDFYGRLLK